MIATLPTMTMVPQTSARDERRPRRVRLFVAITLDADVGKACAVASARLQSLGVRGRFVAAANYHVTVAFLGSVEPSVAGDARARLRATASGLEPLTLWFDAVGAYPNARQPRVAWAGSHRANPRFAELCVSVRDALAPLGIECQARDDPHVTLCRCAHNSRRLPRIEFPSLEMTAAAITLFESFLGPGGARYVALESMPLEASSGRDS